jgi:hypothetical protein
MRSLLTLVGAAVVTFGVVGWFLGWYQVHTTPGPDGRRGVGIDFNGAKIQQDLKRGEERVLKAVQHNPTGSPTQQPGSPGVTLPAPGPITPLPAPESLPQPPSLPPVSGTVTIRPAPGVPAAPQGQGWTWTYPSQ